MNFIRPQFSDIQARLNEPRGKMQVIVGPRQVGKTTLIGQVLEHWTTPFESVSEDDVVGVSADWLAQIWETQRMKISLHKEEKRLLVVDEVQKVKNWSEVVKAEWDIDTRERRNLSYCDSYLN